LSSRLCIAPSGAKSCISIASILFARMDTFQQYDASNVRTRVRPSKKHSNLWTAKGRVTTLSSDFPMPRFTGCRTVSRAHPSRPTAARSTRHEVLAFGSAASSRAQGLSENQPIALPNSSAASRRRARISAEPHRSMVPSSLPGAPCLYNQILRPPSTLIEYLGPTARWPSFTSDSQKSA